MSEMPPGTQPGEEWRDVVGYEGLYLVSSLGRVYSIPRLAQRSTSPISVRGRLLTGNPDNIGYPTVKLNRAGKTTTFRIHVLLCAAFHGPRPPGYHVRHLNGDRRDNRLENLSYGTVSENRFDAVRHGRNHNAIKTHCPQGHPYDAENTVQRNDGWRDCRECIRARHRRLWADPIWKAQELAKLNRRRRAKRERESNAADC